MSLNLKKRKIKPREVHAKGPTAEGLRMMTPRFAMQALQREIMISAWVKIVVPVGEETVLWK